MSTIKAGKIQPPNDSDSLQIFTNTVQRMTVTSGGLVGIGTATPTVALDVVGGIKASTTLNVQTSLTIAESEVFTTQRTFTQSFSATGSGTSGHTVVGDAWLIGSFSDSSIGPAQFKFVHNSHTENNLQSDSYEWSRHYGADVPATADIFSDWVELPVSISVTYQPGRSFRFDVRKKQQGEMELRMRATSSGPFGQGNHHFTFTTTGSAIYTPAASGTATPAQSAPTGFHGRQSYEFPVSKGGYGFAGSTAGVFILNNGNVGIGITAPAVALDVAGEARSSTSTTTASNAKTLTTKDYVDKRAVYTDTALTHNAVYNFGATKFALNGSFHAGAGSSQNSYVDYIFYTDAAGTLGATTPRRIGGLLDNGIDGGSAITGWIPFTIFPPAGYVAVRFQFTGPISPFTVHCTI